MQSARHQQRELQSEFPSLDETNQQFKFANLDYDSESEAESDAEPDYFFDNVVVDKDDEEAIEKFMSKNPKPRRVLADIIMDKITEKQTEIETQFSDAGSVMVQEIDPKVRALYEAVGAVLKQYRSGKLPKAFKVIPNLSNWEQILYCTGKHNQNHIISTSALQT